MSDRPAPLTPPAGPGDWLALVAIASTRPDVVPPRLRAVLQDALDRARAEHDQNAAAKPRGDRMTTQDERHGTVSATAGPDAPQSAPRGMRAAAWQQNRFSSEAGWAA